MANIRPVEINCDMGEGFGRWKMGPDEELMQIVDVANVACGFHAGDPSTMIRTIQLAKKHNVRVGAHPGMPDLLGFGRRQMTVAPDDMYALVIYQVGALQAMLSAEGMPLNHVKPHGELYFYIQRDAPVRDAVLRAIKTFKVPMYGLPTEAMTEACEKMGVDLVPEFFTDIDYDQHGQLVPVAKSRPVTSELISRRILDFKTKGTVTSLEGPVVGLGFNGEPFTICIHSDLPGAVDNAKAARRAVDDL